MRILFATGSPARYMAPPSLGDEQVNCGPEWTDERAPDGRVLSLATPVGDYDLAAIAAKLPANQTPEIVVCLVDASWRNLPRNLGAFKCPRVLLIADTHHMSSPLIGMMRYASAEPFDRIVFLYDRHHLAFFRSAGFHNLHWFPGLTFPHSDAIVRAARHSQREARVAFVGQTGNFHPRRTRLLGALGRHNLSVSTKALSQHEALGHYGSSLLGFNASLNGDLNLRVFEILASGAALLTDCLAPGSGLDRLFVNGRELITYADEHELAGRARHYLAHPTEARAVGEAGQRWFDGHFSENHRRTAFQTLAFDGTTPAAFAIGQKESSHVFFGGNTDQLVPALLVYESIQELHRMQETVRVALDSTASPDFAGLCATLPRVQTVALTAPSELTVASVAQAADLDLAHIARLWCPDDTNTNLPPLAARLASAGLIPASNNIALFARPEKTAPTKPAVSADPMVQARALLAAGNPNGALNLARQVLAKNPRSADALTLIGELALIAKGAPLAEKLFRQALDIRPGDAALGVKLADALGAQGKLREADQILARTLKSKPSDLSALLALSRLRINAKQTAGAEICLQDAVRHHPDSMEAVRALGDLLKQDGRIDEALVWHHRSVGGDGLLAAPSSDSRPRVLFIIQHGPFWPSLASVYRAFAEDPAWETTVVALPYRHPYYKTAAEHNAVFDFLHKEGINFVRWEEFELAPGCADVAFVQTPYDVTRPPGWQTADILRAVPRLAYVPYALEIGGGDENANLQVNLPVQQLAWAVFARSARHRESFARRCATGDAHVFVTGHPKMDALRRLPDIHDPELAAFAAGRKLVVWNPQFDVRPDGSPFGSGYSTFLRWQCVLPQEFARRQDLAFVIRPHPLFFATLTQRQILSAAQIQAFLDRCATAGNILIDRRPSYLPVFAHSSALITDASSFVLEYAATGRPLLYLHNPRGPGLNADGEFVSRHCATAQTEEEIVRFLDQVAAGHDPQASARQEAYSEFMHIPAEGVGVAIKQIITSRLIPTDSPSPASIY